MLSVLVRVAFAPWEEASRDGQEQRWLLGSSWSPGLPHSGVLVSGHRPLGAGWGMLSAATGHR